MATATLHTSSSVLEEYEQMASKIPPIGRPSYMTGAMSVMIADLRNENDRLRDRLAASERLRAGID